MFGYRVPSADQAMLISGGKGSGTQPFRVITGHGAFVIPVFRKVQFRAGFRAGSVDYPSAAGR